MQTIRAYFDGNVFVPIDKITAVTSQRAAVTLIGDATGEKIQRQNPEKSYLRYAGALSDESRVEIEAILHDTQRVDINECSVIDTNVIIRMLNNDEAAIDLLNMVSGAFIPIIVVGELFYGAKKSARGRENMALFRKVIDSFDGILTIDETVAESYGLVNLRIILDSTVSRANNLPLATFDAHFKHISCIEVIPS
jgi:tRNA(fMet)-specific endonuclease VapC